jgi:hypothetical protein
MASSAATSPFGVDLGLTMPAKDREMFSELWKTHLEMLSQGKVVYLLPQATVAAMQDSGKIIEDVAEELM